MSAQSRIHPPIFSLGVRSPEATRGRAYPSKFDLRQHSIRDQQFEAIEHAHEGGGWIKGRSSSGAVTGGDRPPGRGCPGNNPNANQWEVVTVQSLVDQGLTISGAGVVDLNRNGLTCHRNAVRTRFACRAIRGRRQGAMFPDEVLRSPWSPMMPANSREAKWIVQSNSTVPQQRYRVGYPDREMGTEWSKVRVPCLGCGGCTGHLRFMIESGGRGDMMLRAILP